LFYFTCEGARHTQGSENILNNIFNNFTQSIITATKCLLLYDISITNISLECLENGIDISLYAALLVLIIHLLFLWVNQLYD